MAECGLTNFGKHCQFANKWKIACKFGQDGDKSPYHERFMLQNDLQKSDRMINRNQNTSTLFDSYG